MENSILNQVVFWEDVKREFEKQRDTVYLCDASWEFRNIYSKEEERGYIVELAKEFLKYNKEFGKNFYAINYGSESALFTFEGIDYATAVKNRRGIRIAFLDWNIKRCEDLGIIELFDNL